MQQNWDTFPRKNYHSNKMYDKQYENYSFFFFFFLIIQICTSKEVLPFKVVSHLLKLGTFTKNRHFCFGPYVSFLLLHGKLPQTEWLKQRIGVGQGCGLLPGSGCPLSSLVCRIQLLSWWLSVGGHLSSQMPPPCPVTWSSPWIIHSIAVCSFEAKGEFLLRKHPVPLLRSRLIRSGPPTIIPNLLINLLSWLVA